MEFLTASFQVIFEKIFDYTIGAVGRQIRYPIDYKKNVDNLRKKVKELENARDSVQCRVEVATRNVEKIEDNVLMWLTDVEEITAKVGKFFEDEGQAKMKCCNGPCPNLKARHQLSRRAYKLGLDVKEINDGGMFSTIGYREPIQGIGTTIPTKGYVDFDSRKPIFEGVMEALKDENIRAIGVCGMGGTGKTMLVGKVARQAMEENLFEEVVTIVVSQTPNLKEIQKDIAKELGLKFKDEETDLEKTHLLHGRLNQGKKILIIVDDIWKKLDLEAVGISFENDKQGCKILMTSRSRDVLDDMDAKKIFLVVVLSDDEATYLFRKIVGDIVVTSDFQSIAVEVIKECGGLPIAITVVGHALKSKKVLNVWKNALRQLKTANPVDAKDKEVYNCIKLSYKFLTEEGKKLFLFCSIFPEDEEITIAFLWRLLVGLDFLEDVNTVEDVRNSVYTLVEELKASCLLLEGKKSGTVKMHDVVRDVAIYIADKDKDMLTIRRPDDLKNSSNPRIFEDSILIGPFGIKSSQLPERLECPRVKLIALSRKGASIQIPNPFFEGMKNLKVLVVIDFRVPKLPSLTSFHDNLQALHLIRCKLEDIAMIGELKNLKVLNLAGSNIRQLPKEIEQLTDLKLLDLTECYHLKVIAPNVLSNLKKLEELYMKRSFDEWETEEQGMERSNARISDLYHLCNLTTLQIKIPNVKILSKFLFLENLERYEIVIGNDWYWDGESEYEPEILRKLKLCLDRSSQLEVGIKKILKSCECLYLGKMEGVDCIPDEDFPKLKYLNITRNAEIQYIISRTGVQHVAFPLLESISLNHMIKLEKICHGQLAEGSFGNLRKLQVFLCDSLRFMFSSSVVGYFSKLQEIGIRGCMGMSAIVAKESEEEIEINDITTNTMEFPQLRCISIGNLPSLMGFYSGVDSHLLFNEKVR
uniref:Uncharacterized protein n=1 Tax=Fagus sylvatica TaxID=28930 RepID=A0A2N9F9P7_FAGSY